MALDRRYFGATGVPFRVVDGSGFLGVPVAIAVVHGHAARGRPWRSEPGLRARSGRRGSRRSEGFGVYRGCASRRSRVPTPRLPVADAIETFDDHMLFYAEPGNAERASFLDGSAAERPTEAVAPLEGSTPLSQIQSVLSRLARRRVSAYAVDVTSPDVRSLGLSVARVVVPELCALDVSHRARFLGGSRLLTAAFEAGLAPAPFELADLNPLPHPFP